MQKNEKSPLATAADSPVQFAPHVIGLRESGERLQALAGQVGRGPGGREIALAITNLEQAGLWLRQAEQVRGGAR